MMAVQTWFSPGRILYILFRVFRVHTDDLVTTRSALGVRVINKHYEGVCGDTGSLDQWKHMKAVLRLMS